MFPKALFPLALIGLVALPLDAHADDALHVVVDDGWVGTTGVHFSGRLTEVRTGSRAVAQQDAYLLPNNPDVDHQR